MATRVRKLTPEGLKRIVLDEARKIRLEVLETNKKEAEDVKADETEADEYADTLAKKIDFIKTMKIKEARLRKQLAKVLEAKKRVANKL